MFHFIWASFQMMMPFYDVYHKIITKWVMRFVRLNQTVQSCPKSKKRFLIVCIGLKRLTFLSRLRYVFTKHNHLFVTFDWIPVKTKARSTIHPSLTGLILSTALSRYNWVQFRVFIKIRTVYSELYTELFPTSRLVKAWLSNLIAIYSLISPPYTCDLEKESQTLKISKD